MTEASQFTGAAKTPTADVEDRQYVTFELVGQSYCIDVLSVREIRMLDVITPVPGASPTIRGVINLRGSIVPVCDLRMRFGIGETKIAPAQAAVIVSIQDRTIGLLVDQVLDIVTVSTKQLSAIPETDRHRRNPFFSGVIHHEGEMLIAVDLERMTDLVANAKIGELA